MKKLLTILSATLAANFLILIGAIAWGFKTGKLDEQKVHKIRELILVPATRPATQPSASAEQAATQPSAKLEQLLAKVSGRPASEQVEFMQRAFDTQMAQLDRRYREVADLQKKVDLAQSKLTDDRKVLDDARRKLEARQTEQSRALTDQGFKDTLNLYTTMTPRQVKTIFMTLDDATVIQYLRAMEPRQASKITKEFKSGEEMDRIGKIMEKMRQTQVSIKE